MTNNKLIQELSEMLARLFETAEKNVLPFQHRMDAYKTRVAELVSEIESKENEKQHLATELAKAETQLNGIFQMGDRMKATLNAACHHDAITEKEWEDDSRISQDAMKDLIKYQMELSLGWDRKLESCLAFLDELMYEKKCSEKGMELATESWQVMTKLTAKAFNNHSEIVRPQKMAVEFRRDALETFLNERHILDVVIYLFQPAIDEHNEGVSFVIENREKLDEANQKLCRLNEQMERIQALDEKMSQWIYRFFGEREDNIHQQEHDLEMAAIKEPLRVKIEKSRMEVAEYDRLQKENIYLIEKNTRGIEEYQHVVAKLEEVREIVEELVNKLEIEEVD